VNGKQRDERRKAEFERVSVVGTHVADDAEQATEQRRGRPLRAVVAASHLSVRDEGGGEDGVNHERDGGEHAEQSPE
jgi:hypothetical protein